MQVMNATGKEEPSLRAGNLFSMGSFSECSNISGIVGVPLANRTRPTPIGNSSDAHNATSPRSVKGRYCRTALKPENIQQNVLFVRPLSATLCYSLF